MNDPALPDIAVEVAGAALEPAARVSLGGIRVVQKLSLPAQCELTFFNQPAAAVRARLQPGALLCVRTADDRPALFSGEITAVEFVYEPAQGRRLRVRAYDPCHRLRKRQPLRVHRQVGLREIAAELAGPLGLGVEAPAAGPTWAHLLQHGQTDFEFLAEMAARCGLFFGVRSGTLHLFSLEGLGEPVALELGRNLHSASIEINGEPACRAVTTEAWNPRRAETHRAGAARARVGRSVSAVVPPAQVGGEAERTLPLRFAEADDHAEALAQAELDLRIGREVVLRGIAEGNARLQPGTRVDLAGVAPEAAGLYVLTEVTHTIDSSTGFSTEFSTCPPTPPRVPGASELVLGEVTAVDDPDGAGRVKVSLPACSDLETDWLAVVLPGAGAGKGFAVLPDVGDKVLVLCAQGDPARGLVLGGLYGTGGPPEACVAGGKVQRFLWRTPGGQQLRFDDDGRTVRLEDASGSHVEFTPGRVRLHSEADLEIEAPGKTITVRAAHINFEKG